MIKTDNCATSLDYISKGENLEVNEGIIIQTNQDIPFGHKFALQNIKQGEPVKKYGQIIGIATQDIKMGDWIHVHNITSHYLEMIDK
jgi:altronate dehydratase small subunit